MKKVLAALVASLLLLLPCFAADFADVWGQQLQPWTRWSGAGFCRGNFSLLHPSFPHGLCHRRDCAWSLSKEGYVGISAAMPFISRDPSQCSPMHDIPGLSSGRAPINTNEQYFPEISFVYVVQEDVDAVVASIIEVFRTAVEVASFEFVLINDACPEEDGAIINLKANLESHFGIDVQYRKNAFKMGFSASVTAALKISKAYYVALPSIQSLAAPGWLHALLYTIETHKDAAMVGSMTLGGGGKVEAAGGVLSRNGAPLPQPEPAVPSAGALFHARPVDYFTSASSVLFRRRQYLELSSSFADLGSADDALLDMSLAFLLHSGQKTYLQPFSLTILSPSVEQAAGAVKRSNSELVRARYKDLFANYCPSLCSPRSRPAEDTYMYLNSGILRPHVLLIDNLMPEVDRDSGSIRLYELLRILRVNLGLAVSLETMKLRDVRYMLPLMAMGVHVMPPRTFRNMADGVQASISGNDTNSRFREKLRGTNLLCPWDAIIVARYKVAVYTLRYIRKICPRVPVIYDTVDVGYLRETRTLELEARKENRDLTEAEKAYLIKLKSNELKLIKYSRATFVVSTYEQEMLREHFPPDRKDIRVLSNIYAKPVPRPEVSRKAFSARSGLLFVGNMCHPPNIDAVQLLYSDILPALGKIKRQTTVHLHLVMSNLKNCANEDLIPLLEASPQIHIYRDISEEELFALHQSVRLFVAPLRAGAGVKGKLNYALWSGLPIVATGIAAEGMGLVNKQSALIAVTVSDWAAAISLLYNDFELWEKIRNGGYGVHDKYFSEAVATSVLNSTLISLSDVFSPEHRHQHTDHPKCRVFDGQSERLVGRKQCLPDDHPAVVTISSTFRRGHMTTLLP